MCYNEFSDGLFWPTSRQGSQVTQSCSQLHPRFRSGVNVGRQCGSDGNWLPVDLRNCTTFIESKPIMVLFFTLRLIASNTADDKVTDNIVASVSILLINDIILLVLILLNEFVRV